MAMTHRLMPPADGLHPTIIANGRTYTCTLGNTIDVPDQDALILINNGWTTASTGGVGSTAQRPTAASVGKGGEYHDATLGYTIKSDGKVWRNPTNGAAI